jgi:hypothetical protein
MEATGIYWKPVWAVLAEAFDLVLANAMHVKNVPGRKTDVNDAMWLADLLAHGLIRSSFVLPMAVQALRDLSRARKQQMREKVSHVQRIGKTLQSANLNSARYGRTSWAQVDGRSSMYWRRARPIPNTSPTKSNPDPGLPRATLRSPARPHLRPPARLLLRVNLAQTDATTLPGVSVSRPLSSSPRSAST